MSILKLVATRPDRVRSLALASLLVAFVCPTAAAAKPSCDTLMAQFEKDYQSMFEARARLDRALHDAAKWRRAYEIAGCRDYFLEFEGVAPGECVEIITTVSNFALIEASSITLYLSAVSDFIVIAKEVEWRGCLDNDTEPATDPEPPGVAEIVVPQEPGLVALPPPKEGRFIIPELASADGTDAWEIVLELVGDTTNHEPNGKSSTRNGEGHSYRFTVSSDGTLVEAKFMDAWFGCRCERYGSVSLLGDRFKVSFASADPTYRTIELSARFASHLDESGRYPVELESATWKTFQQGENGEYQSQTGVSKGRRSGGASYMHRTRLSAEQKAGVGVCGTKQ